jgi:hypothetical protein
MRAFDVKTPEDALTYIVDCTLATVCDLAMKKSRPTGEYKRQIGIAQKGIDWLRTFPKAMVEVDDRIYEASQTTVAEWAKQFEPTK